MSETALVIPLATRDMLSALRRGDAKAMVLASGGDTDNETALRIAKVAIEQRRQSIAVLGDHEAFIRQSEQGNLVQVVQAVALSIHDKTLYQVPVKRPVDVATGKVVRDTSRHKGQYEWRNIEAHVARLTYEGFNRLNAVAGCNIGMPPTVVVDGERKENPYVERMSTIRGRLGDIQRVVVAVVVVGHAPGTGSITTVSYTLDYDPNKDLLYSLHEILERGYPNEGDGAPTDVGVRLMPEAMALKLLEKRSYENWHYMPLHGGTGYLMDLQRKAVADAFGIHIGTQQNAVKKALTVARRNAMRAHPALAISTINVDDNGNGRVRVIGWAGDDETSRQWGRISARLARGLDVPELEEIGMVAIEKAYDPAEDSEDIPLDEDVVVIDPLTVLHKQVAEGESMLTLDQQATLATLATPDTEQGLRARLATINAMLDADAE